MMIPTMERPATQARQDPPPEQMAGATLVARIRAVRSAPGTYRREERAPLAAELARRVHGALPLAAPGLTATQIRDELSLPAGMQNDFTGRLVREALHADSAVVHDRSAWPTRYWIRAGAKPGEPR